MDFGVVGDGSALLASAVAHYAVIVVIAIAREDLAFLEDFRSRSGKPIVIVLTPRDSVSLRLDPDLVHASLREPIDVPTVAEIIAATVKLIRPWLTRSTPDDGTSARLRDE